MAQHLIAVHVRQIKIEQNQIVIIKLREIDPLFSQTVNLGEPYHVFLQAYDDADLYVTNRTANSFTVQLREGSDTAEFSYRLVATRLGYENARMERAPWADNDPNLYPAKANEMTSGQQGGQ